MTRTPFGALLVVALVCAFAATWPFRGDIAQSVAVTSMVRPLAHARSWRFVPDVATTPANMALLAGDKADLLVIGDVTGPDGSSLKFSDVVRLQSRSSGRQRIVLARIDLTAASVLNAYWDAAWSIARPKWLDAPLCDGREYPVKFWEDDWIRIIAGGNGSELDRITGLGFDGVYIAGLGRVHEAERSQPSARRDMVRFIKQIAHKARSKRPGFIVMTEAEPGFLADTDLRGTIDGIGLHGVLYGMDGRVRRRASDIAETYNALRPLQYDGTPVFAVEFATDDALIDRAAFELRRRGIVPGFESPKSHDPQARACEAEAAQN